MDAATSSASTSSRREHGRHQRLISEIAEASVSGADQRQGVKAICDAFRRSPLPTLEPLLPLLLNLKGEPFSLKDHFPFAPLFFTHCPRTVTFKTGRQVAKTTSISAAGIVQANTIPYFTKLFVTPLYEQIRRLSGNSVRPFIDESPVRSVFVDTKVEQQILQRAFRNKSKLIFSFALLDADRTRGISADSVSFDEFQDMDPAHVEIIQEVLSHAKLGGGLTSFTGTSKTLDGPLEGRWQMSSMAEWAIPCTHCTTGGKRTLNIPALDQHLIDMVGPYHDGISEKCPATICHKCRQPINPRFGRWLHLHPEKRWLSAGYHIPQIIMPIHYTNPEKWAALLHKMQGGGVSPATFFNEVMGEAYDVGTKLVSLTDLKAAASLKYVNSGREPSQYVIDAVQDYACTVLAIDWGGGGEDEVSFTALALLGYRSDGTIDCLWGRRLLTPNDHLREATQVAKYYRLFRPDLIAHDYTGAGVLRETFLVQSRVPLEKIMPISYVRSASAGIMNFVPATVLHPRDHYRADKTRSLLYTTACIKQRKLRFFQYDFRSEDDRGLLQDFLSLIEEKTHGRSTGDMYIIKRGITSDDFAQAVNLGCLALWHAEGAYPNFATPSKFQLAAAQERTAGNRDHGFENDRGGFFDTP